MTHADTATSRPPLPAGQRSDAGTIRLTSRDITGLVLCGEQYGAPYDLLAAYLYVREDRCAPSPPAGAPPGTPPPAASDPAPPGAGAHPPRPGRHRTRLRVRRPGTGAGWRTCAPSSPSACPKAADAWRACGAKTRTNSCQTRAGHMNDGDTATTSPVLPTTPVPLPPGWASPLV